MIATVCRFLFNRACCQTAKFGLDFDIKFDFSGPIKK
jgi:hypothetical protein